MRHEIINDKEFGEICLTRKENVRRVICKVKEGSIVISAPMVATTSEIKKIVEELRTDLRALLQKCAKSAAEHLLKAGDTITTQAFTIQIATQERMSVSSRLVDRVLHIDYPTKLGAEHPQVQRLLTSTIKECLKRYAPTLLTPRAHQLAEACKTPIKEVKIGSGKRTLGTCSADGVITLSYHLLLLPPHLSDYVIYHELAHRHVLAHNREFHAWCNAFCHGREAELEAELRSFVRPL